MNIIGWVGLAIGTFLFSAIWYAIATEDKPKGPPEDGWGGWPED